jgi:hypothetical protein
MQGQAVPTRPIFGSALHAEGRYRIGLSIRRMTIRISIKHIGPLLSAPCCQPRLDCAALDIRPVACNILILAVWSVPRGSMRRPELVA